MVIRMGRQSVDSNQCIVVGLTSTKRLTVISWLAVYGYATLCGWYAKQTIPLSVLVWNQTKAWARDLDVTGSRQGNASQRVGRRNSEKAVGDERWRRAVGSRHRTAEETSWHEIGSSSSEGRSVKMSQHSSWFVEISLEIHASVSLQGMQCHNLTFLHLSWPKPYCSFVLFSFSSTPLIVFFVP